MTDVSLSIRGVHGPYLVALVKAGDGSGPGHLMALDPLGRAMSASGPTWTDAWGIDRELRASIPRSAVRIMADGSLRARTILPTGRSACAADLQDLVTHPSGQGPQEEGLTAIAIAPNRTLDAAVLASSDAPGFSKWSLRNGDSIRFEGEGAAAIHTPRWSAGVGGRPVISFQARTPDDSDLAASGGLAAVAQGAQSTAGGIGLRRGSAQIARAIGQGGDTVLAWRGDGFARVASPTLSACALTDLLPYAQSLALRGIPYGVSILQLLACDPGEPGEPALRLTFRRESRPSATLGATGADPSQITYAISMSQATEQEKQDAISGVLRLMEL